LIFMLSYIHAYINRNKNNNDRKLNYFLINIRSSSTKQRNMNLIIRIVEAVSHKKQQNMHTTKTPLIKQ